MKQLNVEMNPNKKCHEVLFIVTKQQDSSNMNLVCICCDSLL